MLRRLLLSSVAVVGLTGLAGAADMPLKAPPPPVYVPTWTGCYIGGHAGYGTTTSSSQYTPGTVAFEENIEFGLPAQYNQNFDNRGFAGGGQGGCQLQTGTFLWGLEGDWSSFSNTSSNNIFGSFSEGGESLSTSTNQQVSYDSLWSVRGRFGGIFSDVYHLYVTAGIGGAKANYTSSGRFAESFVGEGSEAFANSTSVSMNPTGIVFGAGAEWKIWPSVVIGAEYLHYALFSDTALPPAAGRFSAATELVGPLASDHVHTNAVDVVRFRASYLFNWGGR